MAGLYASIFLIVGAGVVYFVLLSPARVAAVCRNVLEQMTGAEVSIRSAHLSWRGTLDLADVTMRAKGMSGEGAEFFRAHRVRMSCERGQLWRGRLVLKELTVDSPVLTLSEDVKGGVLNWDKLAVGRLPSGKEEMRLPEVRVRGGEFRYGVMEGEKLRVVGTMGISGEIQPEMGRPERLDVEVWEEGGGENAKVERAARHLGARLVGWIDARHRQGQLVLSGLSFSERYRRLLPGVAGHVWDDMEPAGPFPSVRVTLDPKKGWIATVGFEHVAMTLPQLTDRGDYRIRMTDVSGELVFEQERVKIEKELVGKIEGLEYRIAGTIEGYTADAAFRVGMTTEPFVIPDEPRVIYAMPEPVQKVFRILTPAGRVRVSMRVGREQEGQTIDYEGTATLLSAKIRYAKFPYEWTNCRGILKFNRQEVKVLSVTGQGTDGATATATGVIAPLSEDPGVDLLVTAVNVPMDEMLRQAMPARHRPALDLFFNQPAYDKLLKAGHFITAAQYNAEELAASAVRRQMRDVDEKKDAERYGELSRQLSQIMKRLDVKEFDLGGRANVLVHVMREEGPGDKTNAEADVDLQEASIVFRHFPYPMRITSGKLLIRSGRLEFVDWQLTGLHGGQGGLSGTVRLAKGDMEDVEPDLNVHMVGLPLDGLLMDVLPRPQDRWVRILNPSGTIDVVGRICSDARHKPDVDLLIEMNHATLNPGGPAGSATGGNYALNDVGGRIRLSLHHVELDHLTGRHGESALEISGLADWTDAEHLKVSVDAEAKRLKFEEPVWELFEPYVKGMTPGSKTSGEEDKTKPDAWTAQLKKHEVKGTYDAGLHYENGAMDGGSVLRLKVEPASLSLKMNERLLAMKRMHGSVTTDGKAITLDRLGGVLDEDGGRVEVSGDLRFGEGTDGAKSQAAEGEKALKQASHGDAQGDGGSAKPQAAPGMSAGVSGDLTLEASGERLTAGMRSLLPSAVAGLAEGLKINGKYEVKLDRLHLDGAAKPGEPRMSVNGTVRLTGGECDVGVGIKQIDGKVTVDAKQIVGQEWPAMRVEVDAERMVIADRPVEKLHTVLSSAEQGRLLVMPSLRGVLYDGAVGGNGRLGLDDKTYQFHLALSDVDLTTFIDKPAPGSNAPAPGSNAPGTEKAAEGNPTQERSKAADKMKGKLSAAFDVEGKWSQPGSMRGRGDIMIREGEMYDLPLALGLLQITHLSLPMDRSFERAAISYYLQNGVMHFERIVLESPHMRLAGGGTMGLEDRKLDLSLTSDNPDGLKLGPVTDLIDGLRDQFITIRVTGTLDKPDTRVRQFTGFTDAWKDVFGSREEQNK